MNIRKDWVSKGNKISINIKIGSRGTFTGTLTNQAGTFDITHIAVVQGRKVAPFTYNNKQAYQVLPNDIYDEIDLALRKNFALTEEQTLEGKIDVAKREYYKALNNGDPVQSNKWLAEWDKLSAQLRSLYF